MHIKWPGFFFLDQSDANLFADVCRILESKCMWLWMHYLYTFRHFWCTRIILWLAFRKKKYANYNSVSGELCMFLSVPYFNQYYIFTRGQSKGRNVTTVSGLIDWLEIHRHKTIRHRLGVSSNYMVQPLQDYSQHFFRHSFQTKLIRQSVIWKLH